MISTVLIGHNNFRFRNFPIYAKVRVVPQQGRLGLGCIIFIALILKHRLLRQDAESMGKTLWNEHLEMIFPGEFYREMVSESWGSFTKVHRHIKHTAADHAHKLRLCMGTGLQMQSTYRSICGMALIILDKIHLKARQFLELPDRE